MIEEKLAFIKMLDDKSITNDVTNDYPDTYFYKCPKCGSIHVVKNGHYKRKTTDSNGESEINTIQKYLCRGCGLSFKYFPINISSNLHLSTLFTLKILIAEGTYRHLSKIFDVSRNTIRYIKCRLKEVAIRLDFLVNKYDISDFLDLLIKYKLEFNHFLYSPSTIFDRYICKITTLI